MFSFSTALSALKAHEEAVDVVGNNLANLNTSGFKTSGLAFSDLVSQTVGGHTQIGMGVNSPRTVREFSQGPVQASGRKLDAAIQGSGFFVSRDANGRDVYSRVGSFKLGPGGTLLTQAGDAVLGYSATDGVVDISRTPDAITLSVGALLPAHTTNKLSMDVNLNEAAAGSTTFPVPVEVVDSLGESHVLTITFKKDATNPLTWTYTASLPPGELSASGAVSLSGATGTLKFDSSGHLVTTAPALTTETISIKGLADGAADMSVAWNFLDGNGVATLTQLAASSAVSGIEQDGYQASELSEVSIGDGGTILATYSNGLEQIVGQLAIASIRNPETLLAVGNNAYQATSETATPVVGAAGTGGRGQIVGSALEGSNVDIAKEFTNLIVYQRGYQANAKVITAADELSQQTINLIR